MSDDKKGGASLVIGVLVVLALIGSLFKKDSPSSGGSSTPVYESTEDKLRRVYDSQGIKYDNKMLREDARAIEQLHREFGK
ncbi:MAG TPA: hypothetical protein VFB06_30050 [Streptosporangiaceae bacterium]|nr:hypothetical protein [Streptosporangiaceae bacterium]